MKKPVLIASVASALVLTASGAVFFVSKQNNEDSNNEVSRSSAVIEEKVDNKIADESPVAVVETPAQASVNNPVVENKEQRLTDDQLVSMFSQKAMSSSKPDATGYAMIVGVFKSGHQYAVAKCFSDMFDQYNDKFTQSNISSTLSSLDGLLLNEARAREFNQLCLNPSNYL